jgi:hypothetical protein
MIMTTNPRHRTRRLRRLVHAAVAAAVTVGGFVAQTDTASAATPVVRLSTSGDFCAIVTGYIPMGPYETHGYLNNGARVSFQLFGDDPFLTDDFLGSTGWITSAMGTVDGATLYPSDRGIEFEWVRCSGSVLFWLNEDMFSSDELYAWVTIFDGDGGLLLDRRSNTVYGDYSF